jgi:RNA polymerase sigma factor (TIGR02999 family)
MLYCMDSGDKLPGEITALLRKWHEGDRKALSSLASLAYNDLRTIAQRHLRRESRFHTLQATGLVNELFIRLVRQTEINISDRQHFYAFAAMMMRRILTDYARQSLSLKRPTGQAERVPLHDEIAWVNAAGKDMLDLDRALAELEKIDPRKARVVELRYFLGCTNQQTAEVLGVVRATVDRDLQFAKAWLGRRLLGDAPPPSAT